MQLFPEQLQHILRNFTQSFSAAEIRDSQRNLAQRYRQGQGLTTQAHRLAYLVTRLPATYQVISHILHRLAQVSSFDPEAMKTALDLGAGPGTGAWALQSYFPSLTQITCLEKDAEFMALAQKITAPLKTDLSWISQDLIDFSFSKPHDVVLLSYVLGELKPHDQKQVVQKAFSLTEKLLLLIEPGTPAGYRRLMDIRRFLIQEGAQIVAPCPHNQACPLAQQTEDWCHFAVRLERSPLHRYAKEGERMWEDEPYAYLVVSPSTDFLPVSPPACILKSPRLRPGHVLLSLCTPRGLAVQTVSKKDKKSYACAKKKEWGDAWPEKKEDL